MRGASSHVVSPGMKVRGVLSILMALIIPPIVMLFAAGWRWNQRHLEEVDQVRMATSVAHLQLASFDRELWQQYGLWAFQEEKELIQKAQNSLGGKKTVARFELIPKENLFEGEFLREQIRRFMRVRDEWILAKSLRDRLVQLAKTRVWSEGQSERALKSLHQSTDAYERYQRGWRKLREWGDSEKLGETKNDLLLPEHSEAAEEDEEPPANEENLISTDPDSDESVVQEKGMILLRFLLRRLYQALGPVYESCDEKSINQDTALAPSSLEKLAGHVDQWMEQGFLFDSERLNLALYALLCFPASVTVKRTSTGIEELKVLNGASMKKLGEAYRGEAEQLASGKSEVEKSIRWCQNRILILRWIPHLIETLQNPVLQSRVQRQAVLISGIVAVGSLGSILIPPEELSVILSAYEAYKQSRRDLGKLKKGEGVPFWPQQGLQSGFSSSSALQFFYSDYLLFFLLLRPEEKLIQDMKTVIQKHYSGRYFVSCEIALDSRRRKWSRRYGYDQQKPTP